MLRRARLISRTEAYVLDNTVVYKLGMVVHMAQYDIRHNLNAGIITEYLKIYHLLRPHPGVADEITCKFNESGSYTHIPAALPTDLILKVC
jgi:hypothetical protein